MSEDLYKILGVEKNASQEQIKKAYRSLSLKWHPDRNPGNADATSIYQSINAAYEILGDENKRKEYDLPKNNPFMGMGMGMGNMGMNPFPFQNMGRNIHNDFLNIFSSGIFEQMNSNNDNTNFFTIGPNGPIKININSQPIKPPHISKNVEITIEKSYTGCVIPIEINRFIIEGKNKKEENETLYVNIPRGIDDNEIIVIPNKGNSNGNNNNSDVKIQIKIINKTPFKRDGLDMILHKSITLKEALCGFSFDMTFIDNRTFKINNGNGNIICPNYKKNIPGMGMVRDDRTGNLIIIFEVLFPENLSIDAINTISSVL